MSISVDVDTSQAAQSFKRLLNWRQQKNTMIAVRRAGAGQIKKVAKDTTAFKDGPYKRRRGDQFKLRAALKDRKAVHKSKKGWISYRAMVNHAYNVEYGHGPSKKPRYRGRGGPAAPHPFMSTAAKKASPAAYNAMRDKFVEHIRNTLKKARR